jgi:tetratricopeptide (TPR) repeat protein
MRRTLTILLLLAWLVAAGVTALPNQPAETFGFALYRQAQTLVYSEQGSTTEIRSLLADARQELLQEPNLSLRSYWTARTHLLLATHYNQQEDSRAAGEQVELGFTAIEDALNRDGEFSEGLRVQADLHAQMMFARGLFYMARNGSEARRQALRALELDPDNTSARITVAGFYLNAPSIAGGDREEGTAILESTLALGMDNESERFLVLGLLSETYAEADDMSQAVRYLRQAEEIYPESPWLAELRNGIGS